MSEIRPKYSQVTEKGNSAIGISVIWELVAKGSVSEICRYFISNQPTIVLSTTF